MFLPEHSKIMLDSPHLSAKDLGPLIINNISQWKTPEKSYENYEKLCDAIGNKKISFEDFESLFNQYSKKIYSKLEIEEQLVNFRIKMFNFSGFSFQKR